MITLMPPLLSRREEFFKQSKHTHIVLHQIRVSPLNAVIQDGDNNVLSCVAPLPGSFNIHVGLAGMRVVTAVLKKKEDIADCFVVRRQNYHLVNR